jgi:hypothetical protein
LTLLGYFQGKIKGYPVWSNPNNIAPFLDEHSQPPAACPSIVNAKALGMNTFLPWHCSLPSLILSLQVLDLQSHAINFLSLGGAG